MLKVDKRRIQHPMAPRKLAPGGIASAGLIDGFTVAGGFPVRHAGGTVVVAGASAIATPQGRMLKMSGSSSGIRIPSVGLAGSKQIQITALVWITSQASEMIFEQSATADSNAGIYFYGVSSSSVRFQVNTGGTLLYDDIGYTLPSRPCVLTVRADISANPTKYEIWEDGNAVRRATIAVAAGSFATNDLNVGCRNGSSLSSDGAYGDVFVHNAWTPDAELAAWHRNLWAIYKRRIWVPVSAGVGATNLTVAEASHGHSADSLTLSIGASLAINDATHGHAADAVALTTASTLAVADATHAHAADQLTLSLAGSELLTIADAAHAHTADAPALSVDSMLAVAEALHAHAADSLTLSVAGADTLAIADSAHAHTADALALTSASSLAIADASHAHTVDGLTLTAQSVLAIQDALHAHAADNLTLTADNSTPLLIAEALHAHTSDGLSITVDAWLVVADSLHAHRADNVSISLPGQVASEASSTFQVLADYNVFFVAAYDRTFIVPRE